MKLKREIAHNETEKTWGYIETSEEDSNYFLLLGGKEFKTKEEAEKYSTGFEENSYEWKESKNQRIKKLYLERYQICKREVEIINELLHLLSD
jgi:hypothetical protein